MWHDFRQLVPMLEGCERWPSTDDWNLWKDRLPLFAERAGALRFVSEIRPGSRRRRREKKEARLQPGLRTYEARVIEQLEVATRPEHPHDFFNALIWLRYPASKTRLHQIAYRLQQDQSLTAPGQRSREADSLTCFDEGGVYFLCAPDQDPLAVRALFASRDDASKEVFCRHHLDQFGIFGHGLLEGLLIQKLAAVQVSCLTLPYRAEGDVDSRLAAQIEESVHQRGDWGTVPFASLWLRNEI